jgi:hypothetical protein
MRQPDVDPTLDDCLRYAVYAYASKWLPLHSAFHTTRSVDDHKAQEMQQEIRDHLWRRARTLMHAAMTRPCYRSILALFLFSFSEMPADNNEYGFNHLCCEVLFSHFSYMRRSTSRPQGRPLSEYTSVVPPETVMPIESPLWSKTEEDAEGKFEHSRNCLFWLGVISDSTRSLLAGSPSVILPGRSGDAKVWDLIRQRNVVFDQSFRRLHASPLPLPPDITDIVLQHAFACKIMHFGMLNQFLDAAFHNPNDSVNEAAQRVLEESQRFHDTLGPLLHKCAQDYSTMSVGNQLNYSMPCVHSSCRRFLANSYSSNPLPLPRRHFGPPRRPRPP